MRQGLLPGRRAWKKQGKNEVVDMAIAQASPVCITGMRAFTVLDSRGNPTVRGRMDLIDGWKSRCTVPSGASTGEGEMPELRDGGERWRGKGVESAVAHIDRISPIIEGIEPAAMSQRDFDKILLDESKRLGGPYSNVILPISVTFARAKAHCLGFQEFWRYLVQGVETPYMAPVPQNNILNAGRHADSGFPVQETLIIILGASSFSHAMEMGTNVWHTFKAILKEKGFPIGRGDEGGFINPFKSVRETIEAVLEAIVKAGYIPGRDIAIGVDAASSEYYGKDLWEKVADPLDETYHFMGKRLPREDMVAFWVEHASNPAFHIISLEDVMAENDPLGWQMLTHALGSTTQLVRDDLTCTDPAKIEMCIKTGIGNSTLIKPNQIGLWSRTIDAVEVTRRAGHSNVISHRSGEGLDPLIGEMSFLPLVDQIKAGSPMGERNPVYDQIMEMEQEAGGLVVFPGLDAFPAAVREFWRAKN